MKLKPVHAAIAAVLLAASVGALNAQEKPTISTVVKISGIPWFNRMEVGVKEYASTTPSVNASQSGPATADAAQQLKIIDDLIARKVSALAVVPMDPTVIEGALKRAMDRGIVVVNIDNQLDPEVLKSKGIEVPFVGPNNRKGAREVGEYLATRLQPGDEVGIIEGVSTTTNAQMRTAGFKDAMTAAGMKIVPVQSGNWEIDGGNKVAAGMLSEYPNLKAILAGNDSMALGAVSAIRAAGKVGTVQVVGYDNIDAIKPMLKDGRVLATADQAAAKQAVFGIETALKLVKKEPVENLKDGIIDTPVELVINK